MKPAYRWTTVSVLFVLAVLFANKGMDLWALGTDVDGAGIGVYFLIFEINDRVDEMSIPTYAIGFFIASGVMALAALGLILTALRRSNGEKRFERA